MNGLTLNKLAEQAGLEIDAVQFYMQLGLIKTPPKAVSRHQFYSQEEVSRLRFIKRAQKLGFSLNDIKELLSLRDESHVGKQNIKHRTLIKITEVENKLFDLYRMKGALEQLVSTCDGYGPVSEYKIIEALDPDSQERRGLKYDHYY